MKDPKRAAIERVAARRYQLFAGSGIDGSDRPVAAFSDEGEARQAFIRRRLEAVTPDAWARLVVTDEAGRKEVVCWFDPTVDLAPEFGSRSNLLRDAHIRYPSNNNSHPRVAAPLPARKDRGQREGWFGRLILGGGRRSSPQRERP